MLAVLTLFQVPYQRQPWLCSELARTALRAAIESVRQHYPFSIDAFVLLHDHFHCIWTLPPAESDYSTRLRLIKGCVTKQCGNQLALPLVVSASRQKRGERNLWQQRFWEHLIRDEEDWNDSGRIRTSARNNPRVDQPL